MTNPDIANQNRRRAVSWPVFKLVINMEDPRRFLTSESNETTSVIGYIHNIRSNWIFTGGRLRASYRRCGNCPLGPCQSRAWLTKTSLYDCCLRFDTHQLPGEWQDSLLTCLLDFDQAGFAPAG